MKQGDYHNLLREINIHNDVEAHLRFVRMTKESFAILLAKVEPYLTKRRFHTTKRPYISAAERLAITLRFWLLGIHKLQFPSVLELDELLYAT